MCVYWSSYASCRIPGVNVFEFFSSRDSVSEAETAVAIGQVVCALCYLHQANIAHLDIKVPYTYTMFMYIHVCR